MKKSFIISVIGCWLVFTNAGAQEDSFKKKYSCFVKIKTNTDEDISAALEKFTADSVFIALVEDKYIKAGNSFIKILKEATDTAIAVNKISRFTIKYDDNIVYHNDLKKRKKVLKRKNAGRIAGMVFSGIVTAPAVLVGAGPVIVDSKDFSGIGNRKASVSGSTLHVSKKYQAFQLDGDNEKYIEMVQHLIKSKTNPFENNITKN